MIPLKLSQLPQFQGDSSGSYIVINDSSNTLTYIVNKESFFSASLYGTASYSETASYVDAANVIGLNLSQIASGSATASIQPGIFNVNTNANIQGDLTASNFLTQGTITAQTIVVQYITASTELITGSTKFGTQLTDTHQFTGSVSVTGSLFATSSWAENARTASFLLGQAGFPFSGSAVITGSFLVSQSFVDLTSASFVRANTTGSLFGTASWARNSTSSSYALSASMVSSASFLNLIDTPKQYSGYSGSVLVVSSSELGLTFAQTALFDILDFGAKYFTQLLDVPASYLGQADKVLVVSSSEAGLQFRGTSVINSSDFGAQTFTELTDVPASYLGQADRVLVVSSSETGLQFRGTSVIDSSDLGAKTFVELTDAPDSYIAKSGFLVAVSGSETGLEFIPTHSFSGVGAFQFLELTDTPSTYSGKGGFIVAVSGSANALEFVPTASFDSSSFGYKQFIELTDTPSTYSGKQGFLVSVSASALEFVPTASFDSSSFGYKQFIELTDTPSTYSGKQGFLVSVSASALEFVPTASLTGYFPIGMQDMYVGADQMYPTFVSGCADISRSYLAPATINTLDFDSGSEENAQYSFSFPRTWDNSPIQTKVYWTVSGSQSGSVVWGIKAAAYSNAFSLTASFSTEYLVSSSITASVLNVSPYTAYYTPSGSIQTGSLIIINVARKVNDANDNLNTDAKMIGISVKYATNRATAE